MAAALQAMLSPRRGLRKRGTAPVRRRRSAGGGRRGAGLEGAGRIVETCGTRLRRAGASGTSRSSRTGDSFAVSVDGRLHQVDAVRIDAHTLSLIVDSGVSRVHRTQRAGRSRSARPYFGRGSVASMVGAAPVTSSGRNVPVAVRLATPPATAATAAPPDPDRCGSSPRCPAKSSESWCRAGDAVRARQPVVVVEAMKMENELRADRDGTVAEIHTREGMSVEAGALLVVIQ